ncbi:MAG: uroporphyrinogen-III synthase [Bacillales bacterium]|nr:uroporphyrinogen-III synthase [Bacillales bacterium]
MSKGLAGKRVVIGGSRKTEEMSTLIEKQGGTPIVRPLQGTTVFKAEKEVEPDLRRFVDEGSDWTVFTTGLGIQTLLDLAEKIGVQEEFIHKIRTSNVAARGYKTISALKKIGIQPIAVDEDGTTRGLIRALQGIDFSGKKVMIQLHGEKAPLLKQFFQDQGVSDILELLPYQHIPPKQETVDTVCREILHHEVDAVCFTTAIQVHSLFSFAKSQKLDEELVKAFHDTVLPVAVGKVTAEALRKEGIDRYLVPENERMGAMIIELSRYYQQQSEQVKNNV